MHFQGGNSVKKESTLKGKNALPFSATLSSEGLGVQESKQDIRSQKMAENLPKFNVSAPLTQYHAGLKF